MRAENIAKKLKKLKVTGKIFLVFVTPLVLALPFPPPPFNIDRIKAELQNGEPVKQEKFRFLTDNRALGASLFSTILDIKTAAMQGFICISNVSEIYAEGQRIKKSDLAEDKEGGALSIPLLFDDTITQIYVPFASTTCAYPQTKAGFAELENKVEVRGFLPFGKAELVTINGEPAIAVKQYLDLVTVFKMEGEKGYKWEWAVFWKNYALFLIGWMILLSSIIQVFQWIRRKSE
jgi:hypothetical protein